VSSQRDHAKSAVARLLFIGNSYTSRNNLPLIVAKLAGASPQHRPVETKTIVAGGASLKRHWNAGVALAALDEGKWDYVVLQEQSTLPVKNPQRYKENVRLFAPAIAERGAKIALYLAWARQAAPDSQDVLTSSAFEIAAEVGAIVVPVGPAWQAAQKRHPQIALYEKDGSHPTSAGSYLAACVFFVTLFDENPAGGTLPLALTAQTAAELEAIAVQYKPSLVRKSS
jgi:hypothetical protein